MSTLNESAKLPLDDFETALGGDISWAEYAADVFSVNVEKGFWPDDVWDRNVGEAVALVHSELSEAWEASVSGLYDDKLTHLPGAGVELADAAIRVLDMGHAWGADFSHTTLEPLFYADAYTSFEQDIATLHAATSRVLEAHRKKGDFARGLSELFAVILATMNKWGFETSIIDEKVQYNRSRPYKHGKQY